MATIPLKGSERTPLQGARAVAPTDPTERLEVSIVIRHRAGEVLKARVAALSTGQLRGDPMSREEFAARHGADAADLGAVRAFAVAHGLTVVQEHAARRTIVVSGTVAQFNGAFAVQ